jgi:hypothetical protein
VLLECWRACGKAADSAERLLRVFHSDDQLAALEVNAEAFDRLSVVLHSGTQTPFHSMFGPLSAWLN